MAEISVCMATYNGIIYIKKQISSILKQIDYEDELIIVDDCSNDGTIEYIKSLKDIRIKLFVNELNKGHVYSFNKAMNIANKNT